MVEIGDILSISHYILWKKKMDTTASVVIQLTLSMQGVTPIIMVFPNTFPFFDKAFFA
jgi:hypothetical protein